MGQRLLFNTANAGLQTALVCGGLPNERVLRAAREWGLELVDYYKREELVALNALATAEGAIDELLRASPLTIWDSRVLIAGYGRIGKLLATRLRALGAHGEVQWLVNGKLAGTTLGSATFEHGFDQPGAQVVTALVDGGNWAQARFRVLR